MRHSLQNALARARGFWFGQVDCRSLALFRIGFALLLLKDAVYHMWLAGMFYSDAGTLPRTVLWSLNAPRFRIALLDAVGGARGAQFVFLLWIVAILLLLVGYRTRLMTLVNFLLIISVHERNPFVLNGADVLMRNLSFWILFLPLGQVYAVDAMRQRFRKAALTQQVNHLRVPETPPTTYALPLRLVQVQIAFVYAFTFMLKLEGAPWREGTAVFAALQLTDFVLPVGQVMIDYAPGWFFPRLTYYTLLVEATFIVLVFAPFGQPRLKAVGLLLGISLHLGVGLSLAIPNFSLLMVITYLLFVEGTWLPRRQNSVQSLVIARPADGSSLWVLLTLTRGVRVRVDTASQPPGAPEERQIWQEATTRRIFQFDFAYECWRSLCEWWVRSNPPITERPRGAVTGQSRPAVTRLRYTLLSVFLAGLMSFVTIWNLQDTPLVGEPPVFVTTTLYATGLDQWWGMFSPYPPTSNGWIRVVGTFEDGAQVELNTGQTDLMQPVQRLYGPWVRLRKFHEQLLGDDSEQLLDAYGRYFCRRYNILGDLPVGSRLATLEIERVWRASVPYGEPSPAYAELKLWRHWCFEEYQY